MHDPKTVAFQIKYPWKEKPSKLFPSGYRDTFITIWHIDPERDGTDDSCGWFLRPWHLGEKEKALAKNLIENEFDNIRHFFPGETESEDMIFKVGLIFCALRNHVDRHWWQHPRWHFWHWQFQIHPWQKLCRWLFSRCAKCGKRLPWGYAPIALNASKLKFFKGECGVYHHNCYDIIVDTRYAGGTTDINCDPLTV